jgi:hypothetical protein
MKKKTIFFTFYYIILGPQQQQQQELIPVIHNEPNTNRCITINASSTARTINATVLIVLVVVLL